MKFQKLALISVGCFFPAAAVWATLDTMRDTKVETPGEISQLPADIQNEEAEYSRRQKELEEDLHHHQLSTSALGPEERRDLMVQWHEVHKGELEEQASRSKALDLKYEALGLDNAEDPVIWMQRTKPEAGAGRNPTGLKQWESAMELAVIRQMHGEDPEKLRDALSAWTESLESNPAESISDPMPQERGNEGKGLRNHTQSEITRENPPPNATADERRIFEKSDRLAQLQAELPSPLAVPGKPPSYEDMDRWRENLAASSAILNAELHELNRVNAEATARRIAQDHPYSYHYENNH